LQEDPINSTFSKSAHAGAQDYAEVVTDAKFKIFLMVTKKKM
jgi:hypothetical protein